MTKKLVGAVLVLVAGGVLFAQGVAEMQRLRVTTGPCLWSAGAGTPEGAVTGNICDLYLRTNGSSGSTLYIKSSGTGNTGWSSPGGSGAAPTTAASSSRVTRKGADESVTTSTTLQDDDDLNQAIASSETWTFTWRLYLDASATGDFKVALNVPSGATGIFSVQGLPTGATTTTDQIVTSSKTDLTDTGVIAIGAAGSGTPVLVSVYAAIVNSTNTGTVKLRWAQNTSDGTATKLLTSSAIESTNLSSPLVVTSAFSSRPAAGIPGRIFLPTDGFQVQVDTGTVWQGWGPFFPFTKVDDTPFAWVNQGTSTLSVSKDSLVLFTGGAGSGGNQHLRVKTAPATPYTITAFFSGTTPLKSFHSYGLTFRESSTGKLALCDVVAVTDADFDIRSTKWNTATSFNADYRIINSMKYSWLRIGDDGANRTCSFSADGQHWILFHSVTRLDFLTTGANQVGFAVADENIATPNSGETVAVHSWKEQ